MNKISMCALAALALVACAPGAVAPTDGGDGASEDALAALERDTGVKWTVRWHEDVHTPAFLFGRTAPLAATVRDAQRAGRAFLLRYHELFRMSLPDDDVDATEASTDELGMMHARFVQRFHNLPVWGGDLVVHFAADGALVGVNGRVQPISSMPLAASLDGDQARVAAVLAARNARPQIDAARFDSRTPALVAYPVDAATLKLAWRVEVPVDDSDAPAVLEVLIDAVDGNTLRLENVVDTLEGSGVGVFGDVQRLGITLKRTGYYLDDGARGGLTTYSMAGHARLPGVGVHSKVSNEFDSTGDAPGAAVDAHAYAERAWDYFLQVHHRAGWDGKGTGAHVSVHFGDQFSNAFFNGTQLVFGDGNGVDYSPLAGALDVVAHEYTHGVTAHTARLGHDGQTGALNEAISDIFGVFVSYGSGRGADWQIGETVYHPGGRGRAMRDLRRPHATGNPEHMSEYQQSPEDQGGVHENSTIISHAAFLMTEGDASIRGVGVDVAERIWYRALVHYLTPRASFRDCVDATLAAARDLGEGVASVRAAFVAVGLPSE